MNFMKKMRWLKLDKHGHEGSQEIFQLKLHQFSFSLPRLIRPTKQAVSEVIRDQFFSRFYLFWCSLVLICILCFEKQMSILIVGSLTWIINRVYLSRALLSLIYVRQLQLASNLCLDNSICFCLHKYPYFHINSVCPFSSQLLT